MARDADLGIAAGRGKGHLFVRGTVVREEGTFLDDLTLPGLAAELGVPTVPSGANLSHLLDHLEAADRGAFIDQSQSFNVFMADVHARVHAYRAQGGDPDAPLPMAHHTQDIVATEAGVITGIDAMSVGLAAWSLGAGRARKEDPVQAAAGIM